jgi:hypothetical protein
MSLLSMLLHFLPLPLMLLPPRPICCRFLPQLSLPLVSCAHI